MKFSYDDVASHIRRAHPACPNFAVSFFATEVSEKTWSGASIGKAVGITMQTYLRHHMTDYDTLLLLGLDRQEARRRVQPRVNAMLRTWSKRRRSEPAPENKGFPLDDGGSNDRQPS